MSEPSTPPPDVPVYYDGGHGPIRTNLRDGRAAVWTDEPSLKLLPAADAADLLNPLLSGGVFHRGLTIEEASSRFATTDAAIAALAAAETVTLATFQPREEGAQLLTVVVLNPATRAALLALAPPPPAATVKPETDPKKKKEK
jgi:hypothetical protein